MKNKTKKLINLITVIIALIIFVISSWFVLFNSIYQTFTIFNIIINVKTLGWICSVLALSYIIIKLLIERNAKNLNLF